MQLWTMSAKWKLFAPIRTVTTLTLFVAAKVCSMRA